MKNAVRFGKKRKSAPRLFAAGVCVIACLSGQSVKEGTKLGEWPSYAGDLRNFHYSPLDQINGGNFNQLEVAWRFKTDSLGSRPEFKLEGTPLMVKGVVYATAGSRRAAIAITPAPANCCGCMVRPRERVAPPLHVSSRAAVWRTGRTAEKSASFTLLPVID